MSQELQKIPVVIFGAGGYVGGELLRLLAIHPHLGPVQAVSKSAAGLPVHERHPGLFGQRLGNFVADVDWDALSSGPESSGACLFLFALGHGDSASKVAETAAEAARRGMHDARFVDCSGDFRLRTAEAYRASYGKEHPCPELLGTFQFGQCELFRESIKSARYVANPGCMATATMLAIAPLAMAGLLRGLIGCTAITGSSGAGAALRETTHHPWRASNVQAYKPFSHAHEKEVSHHLPGEGRSWDLSFLAVRGPFVRGIVASVQGELAREASRQEFSDLFDTAYAPSPFYVREDSPPSLQGVVGTNLFRIFVDVAPTRGAKPRFVVSCCIDNLVKGAAGQAIQNANLMFGWSEEAGLMQPGLTP